MPEVLKSKSINTTFECISKPIEFPSRFDVFLFVCVCVRVGLRVFSRDSDNICCGTTLFLEISHDSFYFHKNEVFRFNETCRTCVATKQANQQARMCQCLQQIQSLTRRNVIICILQSFAEFLLHFLFFERNTNRNARNFALV